MKEKDLEKRVKDLTRGLHYITESGEEGEISVHFSFDGLSWCGYLSNGDPAGMGTFYKVNSKGEPEETLKQMDMVDAIAEGESITEVMEMLEAACNVARKRALKLLILDGDGEEE